MNFLVVIAMPVLCCSSGSDRLNLNNIKILPTLHVSQSFTKKQFRINTIRAHSGIKSNRNVSSNARLIQLAENYYPYNPNYNPRYNPYYPRYNPYYNSYYNRRNAAQYRHYLRMQGIYQRGQMNTNRWRNRQRSNDAAHKRFIRSIRQ